MKNMLPPLRLVLTNKCNGNCAFCHHEGYLGNEDMSIELACMIAHIAKKLGIMNIALTGGEPTIHPKLVEIITEIQKVYDANIILTSNGYRLREIAKKLNQGIYRINISIASFDPEINRRYQGVDIEEIKRTIVAFPAKQKNFNIVITQDNYMSLDSVLDYCNAHSIGLDIMFDVQSPEKHDREVEQSIMTELSNYGSPVIIPGNPAVLSYSTKAGTTIRIKHPRISALMKRKMCNNCDEYDYCQEKVCAVRVFPDASVSPCLSRHFVFCEKDIEHNILSAYKLFEEDSLLLKSLFE